MTLATIFIVVAVVAAALSFTPYLWPFRVADELGRTGSWFSHEDDLALDARPDGNVNDPAIPVRRLRARA